VVNKNYLLKNFSAEKIFKFFKSNRKSELKTNFSRKSNAMIIYILVAKSLLKLAKITSNSSKFYISRSN